MSAALIWAAQKAAVARWKADGGVGAIVGDRIFDGRAEPGTVFPYVVVGEPTGEPRPVMGTAGGNVTLTAHVFSDYAGDKEALQAAAALSAALGTRLTLEGFGAALLREEFSTVLVEYDDDRTIRHAPIRYRIVSWPT